MFADGDELGRISYVGEFSDNDINGRGLMTFADGRTYEGLLENK